jgi:hypothetical protein
MGFDPCNHTLKIREAIWDSNSQHGSSFGSVRVHSLTLFVFPGACDVTSDFFSWPATLQPPHLGRKPKARVATAKVATRAKVRQGLKTTMISWQAKSRWSDKRSGTYPRSNVSIVTIIDIWQKITPSHLGQMSALPKVVDSLRGLCGWNRV